MTKYNSKEFKEGMKAGIPIGLGYFAVAFSLGIAAKQASLGAFQGFLASILTIASAGEYAGFSVIARDATFFEMAFVMLVANCRYILMSCSLSQRLPEKMGMLERISVGMFITDEIFGVSVMRKFPLNPWFTYGAALVSVLPWGIGTSLGIICGNILPSILVGALGVAIYGMFLAIIIPPAKQNKFIFIIIAACFVVSALGAVLPRVKNISEGMRLVIFTVIISSVAALIRPVEDNKEV